jgi:tetratricopeptide (TPR) repeat protein
MTLQALGDLPEAISAVQKAITIDPNLALAYSNLGNMLTNKGNPDGGMAGCQKAIARDPKFVPAHINLGVALETKGDLDRAVAAYQKANALAPRLANGHVGLGRVLLRQGRFAAARAETREALQLLPEGHPLRPFTLQLLRQAEVLFNLDAKLPAILQGDVQPADAAEALALAGLCQGYKKRYAAALHFYADAFAADARLADDVQRQHRYNAACAAILAAAGKGEAMSNPA